MPHTVNAHGLYADFGFAPPGPTYLEQPAGPGKRNVSVPDDGPAQASG